MSRILVLGPLLLAACLEGDGGRPVGARCVDGAGCSPGLLCLYGRCSEPCHLDRDCPLGQRCVVDPSVGLRACTLWDDCATDPCPPGQVCVDGRTCAPIVVEADGDADADVEVDADPDDPADGGPGSCERHADCPDALCCLNLGTGATLCAPSCGGLQVSLDCLPGECSAGTTCCIDSDETRLSCSATCVSAQQACAEDAHCTLLPTDGSPCCPFEGRITLCTPCVED